MVNTEYQSKIKGLYVIGDVTGLPLVKVAANQGVEVIQRMEKRGVFQTRSEEEGLLDLAIVGGGPAGISAALEARRLGLMYLLLERTRLASTVRSFPPMKKVYSEPRFLKNASLLTLAYPFYALVTLIIALLATALSVALVFVLVATIWMPFVAVLFSRATVSSLKQVEAYRQAQAELEQEQEE